MKIVAILSFMLFGASLSALPLGNPMEASLYSQGWVECFSSENAFSARLGFYSDHVFDRKLEVKRNGHPDIRQTIIDTNAGFIALNWCNRIDLFATLGASNLRIYTPSSAFITTVGVAGSNNIDFELESKSSFSWSVGLRGTILCCRGFVWGVEGAYFSTNPDLDFIKQENFAIEYTSGINTEYHEWQIGTGLAYPVCWGSSLAFVPYAGVKFSCAKLDMDRAVVTIPLPIQDNIFTLFDAENKLVVGFPFGVSVTLCEMIGVTVEGRFGDEQALYVNGQFRF